MNNYRKGRAKEYATMRILENAGYECLRTAGSHGKFDVIAINHKAVRLIQVKCGNCKISAFDREELQILAESWLHTSIEIWTYHDGIKQPTIEVLK